MVYNSAKSFVRQSLMFVTFPSNDSTPPPAPHLQTGTASSCQSVAEEDNEFLTLFPHRFDFIFASHPEPGRSPNWQTERRYPLSDRVLMQGSSLFGVRFGSYTHYCLLDIDINSPYHPNRDPLAIARIQAALEPLGLVAYVACTSSDSQGLHLYFPFDVAQSSWELATAVATLLENAGFTLKPGLLEVFPNPKPYQVSGQRTLFHAHRLPLQMGSYLLNSDLQPIYSTQQLFVSYWRFAQQRNEMSTSCLKQLIKQAKRKYYRISGKADKFINDLNAEIELGWTGAGQTNRLLGRITLREYIFRHFLSGGDPLEGQALVDSVTAIARSLPGYEQWCGHRHEIVHRSEEWARCIENSKYFHYGSPRGKFKAKTKTADTPEDAIAKERLTSLPTWNQQQAETAREKIKTAIAHLLETDTLPAATTARFRALTRLGIGGSTLYNHRDLWHPKHLWNTPPHPPNSSASNSLDCAEGTSNEQNAASLFLEPGRNPNPSNDSSDLGSPEPSTSGRNFLAIAAEPAPEVPVLDSASDSASDSVPGTDTCPPPPSPSGVQYVQQVVSNLTRHLKGAPTVERPSLVLPSDGRDQRYQTAQIARMKKFLASGDAILIAEAQAWCNANPHLRLEDL